jgi:predicted TIM-barrel fold metal-dependent hydrolase
MPQADDDLPLIDAHHHLWDLRNPIPWLARDPPVPFRYGDYSAIRRNFLPTDYRRGTAEHNVVATVTVEAEWDEASLLAETQWTDAIAAAAGFPLAHVARTILHRDGAADEIARHAASPLVRGIRHKPTAALAPHAIECAARGSMSDPDWRRGYRALATHGLHFELQAPWWHVDELLDLISAVPSTRVVINHAFLPADRSPDALAQWRAALKRASAAPQTAIKISGLGIKGRLWRIEDQRGVIRDVIDAFGTARCMFASNFPVDSLVGSFDTIYSGFKAATADLPRAERLHLFHDNAVRLYRLPLPHLAG